MQTETNKSVSEIKEKTQTEEKKIEAEAELEAQVIRSQTEIFQAKLRAEGQAEANTITIEADNYCNKKVAEQQNFVADMNADVTKMEGQTEAELAKVLASRRQFEYLNAKLDSILAMGNNPNLKIFGNS